MSSQTSKKKGGGFLSRQVNRAKQRSSLISEPKSANLTEEDLLLQDRIRPEDVLRINKITNGLFLYYNIILYINHNLVSISFNHHIILLNYYSDKNVIYTFII